MALLNIVALVCVYVMALFTLRKTEDSEELAPSQDSEFDDWLAERDGLKRVECGLTRAECDEISSDFFFERSEEIYETRRVLDALNGDRDPWWDQFDEGDSWEMEEEECDLANPDESDALELERAKSE